MKTNYQRALAVNGIKRILSGLALAAGVVLVQPAMAAYPAPVNLRSCSNFVVLAATETSTTGGGIIRGDVGLSPGVGSKITGFTAAQVIGTIYAVDVSGPAGSVVDAALLATAQGDLTTAYNDAKGRSVDLITVSGNIGGQTLAPGLYWSSSSLEITGDLTLDAGGDPNAVWIFQMGSTLTTAAGAPGAPESRVILAGGAKAENVFWQVGSSATLGTYSFFKGTILANVAITMNTGSTTEGRALARTAAVTFNGTGGSLPTDLPGWLAIDVTPTNGSWRLSAPAGYTGSTKGTGDLAAVSAIVGEYKITYGALSGYMLPTNNNQFQFVVAGVTSIFWGVYRQVSTNIAPPDVTATEGMYTNKVRISWPSVPGITSYEIWKSRTNDVNTAALIGEVPDNGATTFQYDDEFVVPLRSYYYWGLSKTATAASPMSLVTIGYASLAPDPTTVADITASDMVFLPVNVTNLTTAGTVSFRLGNLGPETLSSSEVAFDFRIGSNNAAMVLLGSAQSAFNLAAGQEQLVILTAAEKCSLIVPATMSGIKQVQVTVRHVSTLSDPNPANNKTTAAGMVLVRAAGVNSPARSLNDYDGDGKSDGCLYQSDLGRWYMELSGDRYFADPSVGDVGIGYTPVPGDYDGDGLTDVAMYCHLNGWWYALLSSTEQIISEYFFGGAEFTAAQCDFDGDAKTDPMVYRTADGYVEGAASTKQYAQSEMFLNVAGYQSVRGDFDGDGLADPAAYNRTTGCWAIGFSSNGYQVESGTFGGSGCLPVTADYDGDGLTDPAVYDPGTSYWQVLMSASLDTQGVYTWCYGVLGSTGGTPVPADYDGDGLADLAIYHQDTGLWELFPSSQGYGLAWGFFGGPDFTPVME